MIFVSAGEASADRYGAEILSRLPPETMAWGMGSEALAKAGMEQIQDSKHLGVIGVTDLLKNLWFFRELEARLQRELLARRPRVALLIDYPGLNLRLAAFIKKHLPECRVVYFVAPQVWAWHRSRVRKLPRIIDKLLCILPFEERLHREAGTDATYVGNPSAHALGKRVRERNFSPEAPRILLMPGSRNREIDTMLPKLLGAAEMLRSQHDGISYGLVRASSITEERLQAHLSRHPDLNVELLPPEASHDAMLSSDLGWLTSGTVTLEAACAGLPLLLGYREKRLFWAVYKRLRHTELIGLPNLLLGREEFPELTQELSEPWHWCRLSLEWLGDSGKLAHKRDILRRELLGILEPERDPFAEAAAVISRLLPA